MCMMLLGTMAGCSVGKNEVVVMGMIHGRHLTSDTYSVERVKEFIQAVDPDYVLCEIPPDRFDQASTEFNASGTIVESRVRRFPEYTHALFPLRASMKFEIVPCAAWTRTMANERRDKLQKFKTQRADDYAEMEAADKWSDQQLEKEGFGDDPMGIHTLRYDEITKKGLEPYNRLFNDAIGDGGWDNINRAHFALISAALDAHRNEGKRFLIMFGAGHKYWFLEKLRERKDIQLRSLKDFVSHD